MKKIKSCIIVYICLIVFWSASFITNAENGMDLQNYIDNNQMIVFLPEDEYEVINAKAQIGNIANANSDIRSINDMNDIYIHTTILFDNSLSIIADNRQKMKDIAMGIVENHAEGEVFSLYTIDTELREVTIDSTDYDDVKTKIASIEYTNQDTYLKDVLYQAFASENNSKGVFRRFIVLSDGTDDNSVGYTYNDIIRVIDEKQYSVCAIGSRYENKLEDLEDMFSIVRAASSAYYLLEKDSNIDTIIQDVTNTIPQNVAVIEIPEVAQNGSTQSVKLLIETEEHIFEYVVSAQMPFQNIKETVEEIEPLSDNTDEIINEVIAEKNPFKSKLRRIITIMIIVVFLIIIVGGIVVGIIIYINSRKRKIDKAKMDEKSAFIAVQPEPIEDDESTVLMTADDESTVLMRNGHEDSYFPKIIILRATDGSREYKVKCGTNVKIGRKDFCDIQIKDDKAVSGVHCILSCDMNGNPIVYDNNSSNGTYLNDEKITEEKYLETGDTLEIGRMCYSVQIIGE